jgi:hypothetical protein
MESFLTIMRMNFAPADGEDMIAVWGAISPNTPWSGEDVQCQMNLEGSGRMPPQIGVPTPVGYALHIYINTTVQRSKRNLGILSVLLKTG